MVFSTKVAAFLCGPFHESLTRSAVLDIAAKPLSLGVGADDTDTSLHLQLERWIKPVRTQEAHLLHLDFQDAVQTRCRQTRVVILDPAQAMGHVVDTVPVAREVGERVPLHCSKR